MRVFVLSWNACTWVSIYARGVCLELAGNGMAFRLAGTLANVAAPAMKPRRTSGGCCTFLGAFDPTRHYTTIGLTRASAEDELLVQFARACLLKFVIYASSRIATPRSSKVGGKT
jgi:hypothetical protein